VTVLDPRQTNKTAKYALLALFLGPCPADDALARGEIAGAYATRNVPALGSQFDVTGLPPAKVAFAGVLREDDCAVVSFGCTPADLTIHKYVTVEVNPTPKAGACAAGHACVQGQCN
jgi:hypothetical protein